MTITFTNLDLRKKNTREKESVREKKLNINKKQTSKNVELNGQIHLNQYRNQPQSATLISVVSQSLSM